MIRQYLFGGPHDGKIAEVSIRTAELPVLSLANYSIHGDPLSVELYELRPSSRLDRRYHCGTRDYPRPGANP